MSDTFQKALLFAQAQELERRGFQLQALEAACYNSTPFAHFDAKKKTLTICIPTKECYPWAKNRPFHTYIITDRSLWLESWGHMVNARFTCDINVDEDSKTWRLCAETIFRDINGAVVLTKLGRHSPTPLVPTPLKITLDERRELPPWAIWTKDVEERFCAELDKAWRAFGAEV